MRKIAKIMCVLASLLATSSAVGLVASASTTWDIPYTVGNTTYYSGHSDSPISTYNYQTNYMNSVYTHTTGGTNTTLWIMTAVNDTNYSRFVSASTDYYDKYTGSYVSGYWSNSNGATSAHSAKTSVSNIPTSSLSSRYEFHYDSYIRGADSQYSPIVEDVHFEEALN